MAKKSNEYMRKYMLARYNKRKSEATIFLGGKCVGCDSKENLEFDHKDRKTKGFTIAKLWSVNEIRFWEEIKKCQLLCKSCHNLKTINESGKKVAKGNHGTLSTRRYCACEKCKGAKRIWMKEYMRKRRTCTIVA